jgi:hypothetical protein
VNDYQSFGVLFGQLELSLSLELFIFAGPKIESFIIEVSSSG